MPNQTARNHPNWWPAEKVLSEVLPGSTGLEPDGFSGLSPESWIPFEIDDSQPIL
ncbi:hypothetical protein [Streptodolium elevatio]